MPLAQGDVQGHTRAVGREFDNLGHLTGAIVEDFPQPSPQAHHRLARAHMPVNRQRSAGLQRIEHTLRVILGRIPKVQIHSQPRGGLRLRGQIVKYLLSYLHITKPKIPAEAGSCTPRPSTRHKPPRCGWQ